MVHLAKVLETTFGSLPEGYDDEAKVASFIAGLFLTHRGFASITQEEVPDGVICLEDAWPQIETFEEVKKLVDGELEQESDRIQSQDSGSVRHAQLRAEKAQKAEDAAARKAEKAAKLAAQAAQELEQNHIKAEPVVAEDGFEPHDWLVE